jgi:hypothetical protein
VFVVADGPNFEILAPGPNPADVFYATAPAPGHNSSTFVLEGAATGGGRAAPTRPRSDFELPVGFVAVSASGYSDDGLPLRIRCDLDDAEMVLVPAGPALIGTNDGPSEATPQITVELDAFYIDVTEATVERYNRYLSGRRSEVTRPLQEPLNATAPVDRPALGLSWGAARDYALWAGKELPTEAQWEKAARGPSGFEHPWGNGRTVFHRARTLAQIDPVGSFPLDRSPYGVLDLAGNAREWCLDFYSQRAFRDAASAGAFGLVNWPGPRRPSAESQRVVKGNGPDWKAWHRTGLSMREQRPDVGFRCVLTITPPAADDDSTTADRNPDRDREQTATPPAPPSARRPRSR